jgi:hypothetical protein
MHSAKEMELHDEAVKVTWCACERCRSVGPRAMTIVRHHHEYEIPLSSDCRSLGLEEELISGESECFRRQPSLRNHVLF